MMRICVLLATMMMTANVELQWSTKSPMPRAQAGGAAALFGNTLIVAGGTAWEGGVKHWLKDVQLYDLLTGKWRGGPELPEPLAYGAFAQSEGALEIFGGTGGESVTRHIWRIDASLARWVRAGETPTDVLLGRAARVGRRAFLFGGCADVADLTRCSSVVWMREDEGPWREVAKLPDGPIALSASAVLSGRIFLFGGCSMASPGQLVNRAEAWSFDPATFTFRKLHDLPSANRGLSAVAAAGRVWLFGGYANAGFTAESWSYDPVADAYTSQPAMPVAMSSIEFVAHGQTLWGAGGEDRMRGRSARTFSAAIGGASSR